MVSGKKFFEVFPTGFHSNQRFEWNGTILVWWMIITAHSMSAGKYFVRSVQYETKS